MNILLFCEAYYPRTGYVPAKQLGILASFEVPSENFMTVKLKENAEPVGGAVKYAPEFGI